MEWGWRGGVWKEEEEISDLANSAVPYQDDFEEVIEGSGCGGRHGGERVEEGEGSRQEGEGCEEGKRGRGRGQKRTSHPLPALRCSMWNAMLR